MDHVITTPQHQAGPNEQSGSVVVSRVLARFSDRYVIDRLLGRGGTGVVYVARDVRLGRPVAIKVLHPAVVSEIRPELFRREVRLTASLQHPHILEVLDSGCMDGVFYFITPFLPEGSLYDLTEREKRLPLHSAIRVATDVLEALEYAHSKGLIHCDLKPENILLSNGHAILADFGIARYAKSASRDRERISGSPAYMSPEQAAGEDLIDGRSDVFSLACVVYEMLAGTPPFTGPHTLAVIAERFRAPAPLLSDVIASVPRGISLAVAKALSLDPRERYPSAASFGAALLRASTGPTVSWRKGFGRGGTLFSQVTQRIMSWAACLVFGPWGLTR